MTKRQTRKSYKRKKIILGVCLFASVALVSTGFAAWVLSTQQEVNADGNISVGTVTGQAIEIKNVTIDDKTPGSNGKVDANFVFDSKDDNEGRVQKESNQTEFEKLSIVVKGEITPANFVKQESASISIQLPSGVVDAISKNYINIPTGFTKVESETNTYSKKLNLSTKEEDSTILVFEETIAFTWGTFFEGVNPCEYYDTEYFTDEDKTNPDLNKGINIPMVTVHEQLNTFRNVIDANSTSGYRVTIFAEGN